MILNLRLRCKRRRIPLPLHCDDGNQHGDALPRLAMDRRSGMDQLSSDVRAIDGPHHPLASSVSASTASSLREASDSRIPRLVGSAV